MRQYLVPVLLIALVLATSIALYFTFSETVCHDYNCFQERMKKCAFAKFVNEEPEASWEYSILGLNRNKCNVQVTLLQAKEGDLSLQDYQGHSMICSYDKGIAAYAHEDLSVCHGILKEDLQGLLIKKLHQYIIDNLGSINEELEKQLA